MQINQIRLVNYRNYKDVSPVLSPGINIIHGRNGQGKTNLLESVFLMCRGYSHRYSSTKDLINFNEKAMFAAINFTSAETDHKLALKAVNGKKGWKFDGSSEKSFSQIQKYLACILFEPDDLEIVKEGPDLRRRFINLELSGLVPAYKNTYREYDRIRKQRNALIRKYKLNNRPLSELKEAVTPWDFQMADSAAKIIQLRKSYLTQLSEKAQNFHKRLAGEQETLSLSYKTNIFENDIPDSKKEIQEFYKRILDQRLSRDFERGFTQYGPHSDDLEILINNKPARIYASQGQQRTAAISLKLSHIDLYDEKLNIKPVILLDDILSELDEVRQKNILSVLEGAQTLITCTNPSFSEHLGNEAYKLYIENGKVYEG